MAGKKKGKQRTGSRVDDVAIAERELSKGNTKIAVKHARIAYRRDPSQPSTAILSRALLNRTQDLYARKMLEPARSILEELTKIAGEEFSEVDELRRFGVLLGVGDVQSNSQQLSSDPVLLGQLIDAAVRTGDTKGCPSHLVAEVRQVRASLSAVANGQDDEATESLQTIGRSSPLSDWKLFVRGLIALYGGDADRRDGNWTRLELGRLPFRIAKALSAAVAPLSEEPGGEFTDRIHLESARKGLDSPLAKSLRRLQTALQAGNRWAPIYGQFKAEFGQSHPEIVERVSEALAAKFIRESNYDDFERFRKLKPSLRLDPSLSRITALFHEMDDSFDEALDFWNNYLSDLTHCKQLNQSQRETAIALVYLNMARLCRSEAREIAAQDYPGWSQQSRDWRDEDVEAYQQKAGTYFAKSREHDPGHKEAYAEHCRMLAEHEEIERASRLYEEYASRFEADFDILVDAAEYFRFKARIPAKAQHYARLAEKLRPRDQRVVRLFWECAFDLARLAAREGQFQVAHAELDQVEQFVGPNRELFVLDAMRAAVDLKSGNLEGAQRHYERARSSAEMAPAAALAYCANALQCGVSNRLRGELNAELTAATKENPNPIAAGAMARYINSLSSADITYHGSKSHEKVVATYLKKCPKKSWSEADLSDALLFTFDREDQASLMQNLSRIGCKRFATNPIFMVGQGVCEMARGPKRCNRRMALYYLNKALDLNQDTDGETLPDSLLEHASRAIAMLEMPPPPPPRFRNLGPPPELDLGDMIGKADLPPKLRKMLKELGASPEEFLESLMSGESPEDFIDRYRRKRR